MVGFSVASSGFFPVWHAEIKCRLKTVKMVPFSNLPAFMTLMRSFLGGFKGGWLEGCLNLQAPKMMTRRV